MARSKWAVVLAVLVVLAAVAAVYAGAQVKSDVPQVIRAQRFELVDAQGRVRGEMSMSADGRGPGLMLSDEKGNPRAGLWLLPDGSPVLSLADEKCQPRAVFGMSSDGTPGLAMRDMGGIVRAELVLS